MEALIERLMGDGTKLTTAARELHRAEATGNAADLIAARQNLVDSKEDLMRAANAAQCMACWASALHTYIGEADTDLVLLKDDIAKACQRH